MAGRLVNDAKAGEGYLFNYRNLCEFSQFWLNLDKRQGKTKNRVKYSKAIPFSTIKPYLDWIN